MKFEFIIFGLLLMAVCACFITLFLRAFYHKKYKRAFLFKGLASFCFVVLGALNLFTSDFAIYKLIIFIGLCWGIVGDEIIALCQIFPKYDTHNFLGGGACFIVGHILYMIAMFMIDKINIVSLVITFVLIVVLCVVYENRKNFLVGKMRNSLKLYIGIVILVTAVATSVFVSRGTLGTALFALGGALFTISDNILFAFKFGARPRYRQNVMLHIAYYLAQFVIAFSIACI